MKIVDDIDLGRRADMVFSISDCDIEDYIGNPKDIDVNEFRVLCYHIFEIWQDKFVDAISEAAIDWEVYTNIKVGK